jgi:hypothetical protein
MYRILIFWPRSCTTLFFPCSSTWVLGFHFCPSSSALTARYLASRNPIPLFFYFLSVLRLLILLTISVRHSSAHDSFDWLIHLVQFSTQLASVIPPPIWIHLTAVRHSSAHLIHLTDIFCPSFPAYLIHLTGFHSLFGLVLSNKVCHSFRLISIWLTCSVILRSIYWTFSSSAWLLPPIWFIWLSSTVYRLTSVCHSFHLLIYLTDISSVILSPIWSFDWYFLPHSPPIWFIWLLPTSLSSFYLDSTMKHKCQF